MSHRTGGAAVAAEPPFALVVPPAVVEVLALPLFRTLTDDQARGAVCVWGDQRLNAETAVDLGEQLGRWFPRACRTHVADRAHRALLVHAPTCDACRTKPADGDPSPCEIARALYRLVRDGRR
ncbi:hypothetical protein [Streptomyces parvulus]|uniref:hypothetical protein n=1 Tax=Streptomyces parvulus TaxID=146923 RepID=UPI003EBF9D86